MHSKLCRQWSTLALALLHAVIPPVDDVEADKVEREEHPARLINPEAQERDIHHYYCVEQRQDSFMSAG